jgi:GNAT superfamily N-acetyltransferase
LPLRLVSPQEDIDAYAELEFLASEPYARFVYGEPDVARRIHRRLIEQGLGEFGGAQSVLALDEQGRAVGMYVGPFDASSLGRERMRVARALMGDADFCSDPGFRERASLAKSAFLTLGPGDAYLSRIAVAPAARGLGVGSQLLRHFFARCEATGARRAVLEVSTEHVAASALYAAFGFVPTGEGVSTSGHDELRYRHLAASLPTGATPQEQP